MKNICIVFIVIVFNYVPCCAQGAIIPYSDVSQFTDTPVCDIDEGMNALLNPAALTCVRSPDFLFALSGSPDFSDFDMWGFSFASYGFSFGMFGKRGLVDEWTYRMRMAFAGGNKAISFGVGYEWDPDSSDAFDPSNSIELGMLLRMTPSLSFSARSLVALSGTEHDHVISLGVRPFGDRTLTLFGDYELISPTDWIDLIDGIPSVGVSFELPFLTGLTVSGRFLPRSLAFSIGCRLALGITAVSSHARMSQDDGLSRLSHTMRFGSAEPGFLPDFTEPADRYLTLDLSKQVLYRRTYLFDDSSTLLALIDDIDTAAADPSIAGIAVNITRPDIPYEFLWEIRDTLARARTAGKKIVVFIENGDLITSHFASVADKIVCDPFGAFTVNGFIVGKTYIKGLLEKAGIGFDELRLYKYKTANEMLSRDSMSESDREQTRAYLDDVYEQARRDITTARRISADEFERIISDDFILDGKGMVERKLADETGRWDGREKIAASVSGRKITFVDRSELRDNRAPFPAEWGEPPTIAIVYALGLCAMDSGMNIRALAAEVDELAHNPFVAAIVVRVDSPGGSALASDVLAESLKRCAESKPVVISMGSVAASGGYWISTAGGTIVVPPMSLTGSIGVAGGWIFDNGFKDKLGISTDRVTTGGHADAFFGLMFPFINLGIPDRRLSDDERNGFIANMRSVYDSFVGIVAESRNLDTGKVESIAQGRIWSGTGAVKNGLADETGGLVRAIGIAKEKAGIAKESEVTIVEIPHRTLSFLPMSLLQFLGVAHDRLPVAESLVPDYLRMRFEANGKPLLILDLDTTLALCGLWKHIE